MSSRRPDPLSSSENAGLSWEISDLAARNSVPMASSRLQLTTALLSVDGGYRLDEAVGRQEIAGVTGAVDANGSMVDGDYLLSDIRSMIESARSRLARTVNSQLARLYWSIGHRIRQDVVGEGRAGYGAQISQTLSAKLTADHGQQPDLQGSARSVTNHQDRTNLPTSHSTKILAQPIINRSKAVLVSRMHKSEKNPDNPVAAHQDVRTLKTAPVRLNTLPFIRLRTACSILPLHRALVP